MRKGIFVLLILFLCCTSAYSISSDIPDHQKNYPDYNMQFPDEGRKTSCEAKDREITELRKLNELLEKKIAILESRIKKLEEAKIK